MDAFWGGNSGSTDDNDDMPEYFRSSDTKKLFDSPLTGASVIPRLPGKPQNLFGPGKGSRVRFT